MKTTTWLVSATLCLATLQLVAATPIDAKKKNDVLPKDASVDQKLPKEDLKIEQILRQDNKPKEVNIWTFNRLDDCSTGF